MHGEAGRDPTEPPRGSAYPFPPVPHEPLIGELAAKLEGVGLHRFHMPSAIDLGEGGACVRCGACDGFPCAFSAKGDAETRLIDPALQYPNVTLQTGSLVTRLVTDERGQRIVAAQFMHQGCLQMVSASLFVLSAGAINRRCCYSAQRMHSTRMAWRTRRALSVATT